MLQNFFLFFLIYDLSPPEWERNQGCFWKASVCPYVFPARSEVRTIRPDGLNRGRTAAWNPRKRAEEQMAEDDTCHICRDTVGQISPCSCKTMRVCADCLRKMRALDSRCRVCRAAYPTPRVKVPRCSWSWSCSCSGEAVCFSICTAFLMAILILFCGGMMYDGIHGNEYSASRIWYSLLYGLALVAGMVAVVVLCMCAACCLTRSSRVQPSSVV